MCHKQYSVFIQTPHCIMESAHQMRPVYVFHDLQMPAAFAQNMKIDTKTGKVEFYATHNFDEIPLYTTVIPVDKIAAAQQAFRMEDNFYLL